MTGAVILDVPASVILSEAEGEAKNLSF
jgi:hypothetical protein